MSDAPPVVALKGVRVTRGDRLLLAVDDLAVRPGEILAVMGPNGSGKSTLLRVLGLIEAPAAGALRFEGRAVTRDALLRMRRRTASVFQDALLVDASVHDNVALGLRFRRTPRGEREARVSAWLARLGIAHLARRRARTLSSGEAQRAALARALVLQPSLLLLDEPFAALDQPTREALIAELGPILRQDRITTVFVTHDRGEALALGDRVAALIEGRIVQLDEAARVFRRPATEAVARFVGMETLVEARVAGGAAGLLTLDVAGARVEASGGAMPGARVRLCLRPEDVTILAPGTAAGTGPRNRLAGVVKEIAPAGMHVRVVVECGFPLVALVPRWCAEELGLAEGSPAVATFEPRAAHVLPDG